jgi:hypothetical protein
MTNWSVLSGVVGTIAVWLQRTIVLGSQIAMSGKSVLAGS